MRRLDAICRRAMCKYRVMAYGDGGEFTECRLCELCGVRFKTAESREVFLPDECVFHLEQVLSTQTHK